MCIDLCRDALVRPPADGSSGTFLPLNRIGGVEAAGTDGCLITITSDEAPMEITFPKPANAFAALMKNHEKTHNEFIRAVEAMRPEPCLNVKQTRRRHHSHHHVSRATPAGAASCASCCDAS